ncbi:hypothetical protein [Paenibacillus sp. AN1007]|uniref:Uncharacterized protein n=1 Tax=Paenibacillus sp. AN1007 TaxID=3151385 RepID=A0AAU8NGN1_9BACL
MKVKKRWIWMSASIVVAIVGMLPTYIDYNQRQNEYYVFMENNSEYVTQTLEKNDIPYLIDERGRLLIKRKYDKKVVVCCT